MSTWQSKLLLTSKAAKPMFWKNTMKEQSSTAVMSPSDILVTACIAATLLSWPSHVNPCQDLAACRQGDEFVNDSVVYELVLHLRVGRANMLLALPKSAFASFELPSRQQTLRQP